MSTTLYVTKEQAEAATDALKQMRLGGWQIDGIEVTIPKDGSGCFITLKEQDYNYKFLFQFGMKTGFLLNNKPVKESNEPERVEKSA